MGSGLVIDDGGSTRIKWMRLEDGQRITGKMKDLMTVIPQGRGRGKSTQVIADEPYNKIRIVYQDNTGSPKQKVIQGFNKIIITSDLGQNVEVENIPTGLQISLSGDVVEPVVEARQHELQRRYIVSNSGYIEQVEVDGQVVYDKNNILPNNYRPVIYTSVVLT